MSITKRQQQILDLLNENGFISVAVYDDHSKKEDDLKRKYSHLFIYDFKELL